MWFRGEKIMQLAVGNTRNLTSKTQLTTKVQYGNKGTGSISLKVTSHDHPEIAYSLLVPVLGAIWARARGEEVF